MAPGVLSTQPNQHLPPHLREVCAILARGLVRLRSRAAGEIVPDAAQAQDPGESSLHFTAHQRSHATRNRRRLA